MKISNPLKMKFLNHSAEWTGGVIAGFGFGMFVMAVILSPEHRVTVPWVWFLAFGCIMIGPFLARDAQRKKSKKDVVDEKQEP